MMNWKSFSDVTIGGVIDAVGKLLSGGIKKTVPKEDMQELIAEGSRSQNVMKKYASGPSAVDEFMRTLEQHLSAKPKTKESLSEGIKTVVPEVAKKISEPIAKMLGDFQSLLKE
jgi:hypothetical protein